LYSHEFEVTGKALPTPPVARPRRHGDDEQRLAPVGKGAGDATAVGQKPRHRALHVNVEALVRRDLGRADHLEAGAVAGIKASRFTYGLKAAAGCAKSFMRSKSAPLLQLAHAIRRFLGVELRHAPVIEERAASSCP
jgi:hypothetical protein